MIAYVKNRSDFKTSLKLQVPDYDYCINSAYENISSFIVVGEYSGLEDSFLVFEEYFGVISSCAPKDGLTTIQCQKIVTIFSRQLVLTESEAYIEDFMKRVIETEYKNLADTVFAMPYINVTITSHTAYSRPVNDNGIWQLEKYISRVKRLFDIYTDITVNNNVLQVTIGKRIVPTHNVDFNNSNYDLIQETYSSEAVSKISVVNEGTITDYYLFDDGTYGTNPSAGTRVKGKWEFRESADNIGYVFASNSDSHLIQFRSYQKFLYGDKLAVRSNGRVIYTYINQILRDSKDDRYLYKTGNVTETASEIISEQGEDIAEIQQTLEFDVVKKDGDADINGDVSATGDMSIDGEIYEGGTKLSDKYKGKFTELWTSTASSLSAGTTPLSESANNFDFLLCSLSYWGNAEQTLLPMSTSGTTSFMVADSNLNNTFGKRSASVSNITVTWTNGRWISGGSGDNSTSCCVPHAIWGIKL